MWSISQLNKYVNYGKGQLQYGCPFFEGGNKMAQFYDISSLITNEQPKLQITNELIVTVNNRKSTMLSIQAMIEEDEKQTVLSR